jgi:lysozyme
MIGGIDVSHWNGAINWPKLAEQGVQFAYIKATQGLGEDPAFETNAKEADAAGIWTLAYTFLTAHDTEACVDKFKSVTGDMAAVLDWETAGVLDHIVLMWIAGLKGKPTLAYYGLYPPDAIAAEILPLPRIFPEYASQPRLPAWDGVSTPDWHHEWLIWQSSKSGTFQGEVGHYDLDKLAVDLDRFKTWCKGGVL